MPWYASDGLLYLAIAISAYYAYQNIPDTLNHIRNQAACPEPAGQGPRKQLQKDAENAVSIDTLRILADGHSYDLRASTIKIVASRTVKSRTKKLLLKDLVSKDEDRRYNAICGMWMLLYNPALHGRNTTEEFMDFASFRAVITALKHVLADHNPDQVMSLLIREPELYPEPEIPPSPIKVPVRPYHEFSLIYILRVLLKSPRPYEQSPDYPDNVTCALSAGLVTDWLKDYPFPCALPQNAKYNYKKSDVTRLFEGTAWRDDDPLMAAIFYHINMSALGKKHLRDAGLRGSSYTELEDVEGAVGTWRRFPQHFDTDSDNDVRMINGESTAGAVTPPPIAARRQWNNTNGELRRTRSQELSREEETLRRRRREAVVVAEPGAPFSQDNILQRTDSGSTWPRNRVDSGLDELDLPFIPESPTEVMVSVELEEMYQELISPFEDAREMLEALREDAMFIRSDPVDALNRIDALARELRQHRQNMLHNIRQSGYPRQQTATIVDRIERVLSEVSEGMDSFRRTIASRGGLSQTEAEDPTGS